MDKHQRKRLRDNDRYIGKRNDEIDKFFRTDRHIRDKRFIYETLRLYTPRFVSLLRDHDDTDEILRFAHIDGYIVNVWMYDAPPPGGPYYWMYRGPPAPLLSRMKDEVENQRWRIVDDVGYEWDSMRDCVLVKESLKKFRHQLDVEMVQTHGPSFFRTTDRTKQLRADLIEGHSRMRAILACKRFKEDLMAAAWHPRRVGYILETYGWEVYENLLVE